MATRWLCAANALKACQIMCLLAILLCWTTQLCRMESGVFTHLKQSFGFPHPFELQLGVIAHVVDSWPEKPLL